MLFIFLMKMDVLSINGGPLISRQTIWVFTLKHRGLPLTFDGTDEGGNESSPKSLDQDLLMAGFFIAKQETFMLFTYGFVLIDQEMG
jgi:hypothetical protein